MPISYFGGKNKEALWIHSYVPKEGINTWLSCFSGAFWEYFNLETDFSNIPNIIYNDLNKYMSNMVSCTKEPDKLLASIDRLTQPGGELYTPLKTGSDEWKTFIRETYYSYNSKKKKTKTFLDEPNFNIPDYDAAALYSFLITSTFNGCFPNTSSGAAPFSKDKLKLSAFINKLNNKDYRRKFQNITKHENLDFEIAIKKYDSKDTFVYVDAPYFDEKAKRVDWYGAKDIFDQASHERLANLLKTVKARWCMSYYYFEDLEKWFPKDQYFWVAKDFYRSSASGAKENSKGEEILVMNYDPSKIECRK